MGSLDLFNRFWKQSPASRGDYTFNGEGERLCDNTPLGQEKELERLKEVADHRGIDGWMDYLEAEAIYEENLRNIQNAGIPMHMRSSSVGRNRTRSPFKKDREARKERLEQEEQQDPQGGEDQQEIDRPSMFNEPGDDVERGTIGDVENKASEEKDDDEPVTNKDTDVYEPPATDEYGYGSLRLPEELLCLLKRAKVEHEEFNSTRAVVEAMARNVGKKTDNFEDDNGGLWPEWHATLKRSLDVPHPENGD